MEPTRATAVSPPPRNHVTEFRSTVPMIKQSDDLTITLSILDVEKYFDIFIISFFVDFRGIIIIFKDDD